MTETYIATAEQELSGLREWLLTTIGQEIDRRLTRIQGGADGWRYRCLSAEKRNADLVDELRRVREELNDLKYREGSEWPPATPSNP